MNTTCLRLLHSSPLLLGSFALESRPWPPFAPIYFGEAFEPTGHILQFLILAPIVSGFANVIRTQYLIPKFMDKVYVISTIAAALVNLTINLVLIPSMQAMGAVVGTICAESTVLIIQAIAVRHDLPWRNIMSCTVPYLLVALTCYIFAGMLNMVLPFGAVGMLVLDVLLGGLAYAVFLFLVARKKRDYIWGVIAKIGARAGLSVQS